MSRNIQEVISYNSENDPFLPPELQRAEHFIARTLYQASEKRAFGPMSFVLANLNPSFMPQDINTTILPYVEGLLESGSYSEVTIKNNVRVRIFDAPFAMPSDDKWKYNQKKGIFVPQNENTSQVVLCASLGIFKSRLPFVIPEKMLNSSLENIADIIDKLSSYAPEIVIVQGRAEIDIEDPTLRSIYPKVNCNTAVNWYKYWLDLINRRHLKVSPQSVASRLANNQYGWFTGLTISANRSKYVNVESDPPYVERPLVWTIERLANYVGMINAWEIIKNMTNQTRINYDIETPSTVIRHTVMTSLVTWIWNQCALVEPRNFLSQIPQSTDRQIV